MNLDLEWLDRIAWVLIHSLWQGAILALILKCILVSIPETRAEIRCLAASIALFAIPAWMAIGFLESAPAYSVPATTLGKAPPTVPSTAPAPSLVTGTTGSMLWLLSLSWSVGVVFQGMRLLVGGIRLHNIARGAIDWRDRRSTALLRDLEARIGLPRPVRLCASHHVDTPLTVGWVKPVVIFPIAMLSGMPPSHFDAILTHELIHVRRGDYLLHIAVSVIGALLFYHPAAHWILTCIQEERERACDDESVRTAGSLSGYIGALVWAERKRAGAGAFGSAVAFGNNGTLARAERLQRTQGVRPPVCRNVRGLSFALCIAFAVPLLVLGGSEDRMKRPERFKALPDSTLASAGDIPTGSRRQPRTVRWEERHDTEEAVPLFRSVILLERDGIVYDPRQEEPRLFKQFPNRWILEHDLDLLSGLLPYQDPDRDGFNNTEEYTTGTSPKDAADHPPVVHKLQFLGMESQDYSLRFAALPDENTAQLHLLLPGSSRTESAMLRTGDRSSNGIVEIVSIDPEKVVAVFLPTGATLELPRKEWVRHSVRFAKFRMSLGAQGTFVVQETRDFRLHLEPDNLCRLVSVDTSEAVVRTSLPDGSSFDLRLPVAPVTKECKSLRLLCMLSSDRGRSL